ncbi:multisubunit sodium/proton antiporter, MrpC subunit (TC 2.A.63.1) [Olivibacter domesticus]|uniref:Multisubunit sodium/proton antiporter, MrpC subunit (TC 2.A.63.1) n=2 Tax=Olivibacter domesticus TaxID=407022 RepID=A0A1H7PVH9_OLID1|nr:multisubunit sodium/proton antiporter, MrpC subunit (TC 2.A.63.1) [Olivibacter domesticus]
MISILTGFLFATGLYLLLHKSFMKLIAGVILFGNACNMFLLIAGGLTRNHPAFVSKSADAVAVDSMADPVPQAFILTAIVIGLGVQAFVIVLLKRIYQTSRTNNLDELTSTDRV